MASPTVKLESIILSLLVDAKENRDVATTDVVGAYLIADMKDHIIVKIMEESLDIICKANAKYIKCETRDWKNGITYEAIESFAQMHAIFTIMAQDC